jgi:dihydroneopterin aldolase
MLEIFLENYTLISKHGYYKEEHFKPQRFVVSVNCQVKKAGKISDNLQNTLNYEVIRKIVHDVVMGEHKKLLETLSEEIAKKVIKYKSVKKVTVKISKPDIWGDSSPGVVWTEGK